MSVLDAVRALPGEIWDRATTVQPAPSQLVVLGALVVVLLCLAVPTAWHLSRHVLTIVHESVHALVAVLSGRRLSGIRVHSDASGLTVSVGKPRGPGMVATAFAGYVGPAVLGLVAAWELGQGYAVGLLWGLVVALTLLVVQVRNWYGLWAVLVTGVLLIGVTWWGSSAVQVAVAYVVTWYLLLGAPRAVLEMQSQRRGTRGRGTSDADMLGRLTPLPAGWCSCWCAGARWCSARRGSWTARCSDVPGCPPLGLPRMRVCAPGRNVRVVAQWTEDGGPSRARGRSRSPDTTPPPTP